jgi:putative membrane protein
MMALIELALILFVVAAFVVGLVGGLAWVAQLSSRTGPKQDPEQVLAHRFAKGEIDEKEYARRLSILRLGPPLEID